MKSLYFRRFSGFNVVNKKLYYFMDRDCAHYTKAKRGLKLTGWRTVGGVRYYIKESGVVAKGVTVIRGKTYIFSDDGRQLKRGIVSVNGGRYFVNLNGIVQKSRWLNVGGKKYYALWNGKLKTGLMKKDGKEYFFGDDGALVTNARVQADGTTRYADKTACSGDDLGCRKTWPFSAFAVIINVPFRRMCK